MSRTSDPARTHGFEYLQIRPDTAGVLHYVAWPSGQTETWFRLTTLDGEDATFENPQHDFPQTLRYRLDGNGLMVVEVSATVEGRQRGFRLSMRPGACY